MHIMEREVMKDKGRQHKNSLQQTRATRMIPNPSLLLTYNVTRLDKDHMPILMMKMQTKLDQTMAYITVLRINQGNDHVISKITRV